MGICATLLYLFDLSGRGTTPQIDRDELILLGLGFFGLLCWFGLRRIREQERQIARTLLAETEARHLANHDPLTGLPNRRGLQLALAAAFQEPPTPTRTHALLLFDLNGFKQINDIHGHATGDAVLAGVARRMSGVRRTGDTFARMGGDEFALVLRDAANADEVVEIGRRIVKTLEAPIAIDGETFHVGSGVGAALIPADGPTAAVVLRKADLALYRAKERRASGVVVFDEAIEMENLARDGLARDLAAAIETAAIVPYYQPIIELESGDIRAFEALARWTHPTLGPIAPDCFIPLAEATGLIHTLSEQLLRRACEDALAWPAPVRLCFNISPVLLRDETLGLRILHVVGATRFPLHRLELEITEGAVASDLELASSQLEMLREAGLRIVLDDFGAGATTLDHLRRLCFDGIKIDRRFVQAMTRETGSATIVRTLLDLASGLGLDVVAEGIEEDAQRQMLYRDGCRRGQGFLYSRAVPFAETIDLIGGYRWAETG